MTYAAVSETYGDFLNECVCCGGNDIRFWRKKYFQYTNTSSRQEFRIFRCDNCGSGFLNQPPAAEWLQAIYQYSGQALTQAITLQEILRREAEFPNVKLDADRISLQAHRFNRSANNQALDIGSGFGFYTKALRDLAYRTVSINPGKFENQVFKDLNGDEPLAVMFENYQTPDNFGVVVMSQVLEHLLEPDRALGKVSGLLASGGVLACAVPNYASFLVKLLGTKENACLWVPEHVNYFTEKGLKALFERNGLQIVKMEQITRIPFDALSKRLRLTGKTAVAANSLVELMQVPFGKVMNFFGLGIYINLYAVKK